MDESVQIITFRNGNILFGINKHDVYEVDSVKDQMADNKDIIFNKNDGYVSVYIKIPFIEYDDVLKKNKVLKLKNSIISEEQIRTIKGSIKNKSYMFYLVMPDIDSELHLSISEFYSLPDHIVSAGKLTYIAGVSFVKEDVVYFLNLDNLKELFLRKSNA